MGSQQTEPALQVQDLSMAYKEKVLDGINLHVMEGEIFGLIGISGSGKTTLLELLIGFLKPQKGDVLYRERLLDPKSEGFASVAADSDSAARLFGIAAQNPSFYDHLTVRENLAYFGALYDLSPDIVKKNMATLLDVVGLTAAKDVIAGELSSGMKKRLDIACALIHNPKILVLDEPTADLDVVARKQIWSLLKRINANGTTIVLATHLLDELETLCDSVAILHGRRIVGKGGVEELRKLYADKEQVVLQTERRDYAPYASILARQKDLGIEDVSTQGNKMVVRSAKAEETLHLIIHLAEKLHDRIVDISLAKPSLNEVFETATRSERRQG